jgi:hypothetical protein
VPGEIIAAKNSLKGEKIETESIRDGLDGCPTEPSLSYPPRKTSTKNGRNGKVS